MQPTAPTHAVAGKLTTEDQTMLTEFRQKANAIVTQIGQTEVTKSRLLGNLAQTEHEAQAFLSEIGTRMGITGRFHVQADGTLLVEAQPEPSEAGLSVVTDEPEADGAGPE